MSRPCWYFALLALASAGVVACGARFDPAHFEGSREARRAEPEALLEVATGSHDLEALGDVHASCVLESGFRRLEGQTLSDVDCSTERLVFALRESAAAAGGEALVGLHCSSRGSPETRELSCSAAVARFGVGAVASRRPLAVPRSVPAGRPAPSPSEVRRIDEPDAALAFRISLYFEPSVPAFERRERATDEVRELFAMPLADRALGDLRASCESGCEERALRRSVLTAADDWAQRTSCPCVASTPGLAIRVWARSPRRSEKSKSFLCCHSRGGHFESRRAKLGRRHDHGNHAFAPR